MNRRDAEDAEIVYGKERNAWLAPSKKVNKTNENPNIFLFPVYSLSIEYFCNLWDMGQKGIHRRGRRGRP
jgi:hypothetical protein